MCIIAYGSPRVHFIPAACCLVRRDIANITANLLSSQYFPDNYQYRVSISSARGCQSLSYAPSRGEKLFTGERVGSFEHTNCIHGYFFCHSYVG